MSEDEELRRVLPVVEALAGRVGVPISVDTMKAEVARRALAAGAALINDVSALRFDPAWSTWSPRRGCPVCLMHMRGEPKTMQDDPRYDDVVDEVLRFLEERMAFALARGLREDQLMVDPGIGFGKTVDAQPRAAARPAPLHRRSAGRWCSARRASAFSARSSAPSRRRASSAPSPPRSMGLLAGAHVFRVHDVKPNFEALRVGLAVLEGAPAA